MGFQISQNLSQQFQTTLVHFYYAAANVSGLATKACVLVWEVNSAKIKWCTLYIKQVERRRACPSGGACFVE